VLLNDDVVEELKDDPAVDPSRIAIAVDDGVVTMSGSVPTYWQKEDEAARRASWSVPGVTKVEDHLVVG